MPRVDLWVSSAAPPVKTSLLTVGRRTGSRIIACDLCEAEPLTLTRVPKREDGGCDVEGADEGRAVAVVASQLFFLLRHAAVGGLRLAASAEEAGLLCHPWLNVAKTASAHHLQTLALLTNIHPVITNNAMEIIFSMLCRNINCRYEDVNCKYVM